MNDILIKKYDILIKNNSQKPTATWGCFVFYGIDIILSQAYLADNAFARHYFELWIFRQLTTTFNSNNNTEKITSFFVGWYLTLHLTLCGRINPWKSRATRVRLICLYWKHWYYTVSQNKTPTQSFCYNFGKCEPILIILSLLHSAMNCGRSYYIIRHLSSNL